MLIAAIVQVLCTDGLPNIGVGSVDVSKNEEAGKFYAKIGKLAQISEIIVSIIGLDARDEVVDILAHEETASVGLAFLAKCAQMTQGKVHPIAVVGNNYSTGHVL